MSAKRSKRGSGQQEADPAVQSAQPVARNWIWFRYAQDGRWIGLEEFKGLDVLGRAGLAKRMQRYRDGQARAKDVDHLGDGIFELRHRVKNVRFRLLFIRWGPHLVALTAFQKDQPKTPKPDLDRARDRARRWVEVFGAEPADYTETRQS